VQLLGSATPVAHTEWAHVLGPGSTSAGGGAVQLSPQIEATSPTQVASHALAQQYGSAAQSVVAQGSHAAARLMPVAQRACAQVLPPSLAASSVAVAAAASAAAAADGAPASDVVSIGCSVLAWRSPSPDEQATAPTMIRLENKGD
jgi:hypothetical protein